MKASLDHLDEFRIRLGRLASTSEDDPNGAFIIPHGGHALQIISSNGMGWDHVSVVPVDAKRYRPLYRTPTWEEMCAVKGWFFDDDECVIEYHPPKKSYRNAHEY